MYPIAHPKSVRIGSSLSENAVSSIENKEMLQWVCSIIWTKKNWASILNWILFDLHVAQPLEMPFIGIKWFDLQRSVFQLCGFTFLISWYWKQWGTPKVVATKQRPSLLSVNWSSSLSFRCGPHLCKHVSRLTIGICERSKGARRHDRQVICNVLPSVNTDTDAQQIWYSWTFFEAVSHGTEEDLLLRTITKLVRVWRIHSILKVMLACMQGWTRCQCHCDRLSLLAATL